MLIFKNMKIQSLCTDSPKLFISTYGSPGHSDVKEFAHSVGDLGSVPGSGRPLEKGMTTHSSILAWRIPWTEKPGELQSMGSQRIGHN